MGMSSSDLIIFYRTSDKGRIKPKLFSNRWSFLKNTFDCFGNVDIICVADNVTDESYTKLSSFPFHRVIRSELGNSKSFWFSFEKLLEERQDYKYAYFLEDDYIHAEGALAALLEGLELADYVTLYDHPDKYYHGINPLVSKSGGEESLVLLSESTHWKTTNSTTMTFAANLEVLKKDYLYFKMFTKGLSFGRYIYPRWFVDNGLPRDYRLWRSLSFFRRRRLISCIPGLATHGETDQLTPLWK